MPAYNLNLKAGTDPSAESLPATLEDFLTKIREYTEVAPDSSDPGGDTVRQILVQSATPTGVSADDLWVKLDAVTSRPIGLFAYQGSTWNPVGLSNGGNTASRPQTGVAGETYFDTDIDVMLVWSGTAWVTQSGSPGDIKFVYLDRDLYTGTAAETEAERLNPGWKVIPNARGMSLVAADHTDTESFGGDQKYQAAGWTFGSKTHTLVEAELPVHNHNMYTSDGANDADSSGGGAGYGVSQSYSSPAIPSGTAVEQSAIMEDIGSDDAHENRPPSFTAYCLIKEGYENTGTDHTGL